MIVCDTGPIVAAALAGDDHHRPCVDLFRDLHLANRPLLVPATVVAEVGYLLNREAGPDVEALFPTALADNDFTPIDLTADDYRRAAELVTTYADLPLGTTDATVIALAERLSVTDAGPPALLGRATTAHPSADATSVIAQRDQIRASRSPAYAHLNTHRYARTPQITAATTDHHQPR